MLTVNKNGDLIHRISLSKKDKGHPITRVAFGGVQIPHLTSLTRHFHALQNARADTTLIVTLFLLVVNSFS